MKSAVCIIFLLCFFKNIDKGSALRCFACSAPIVGHKSHCEKNVNEHTVATSFCGYGYTTCMTLVLGNNITRACAMSNVCSAFYNSPVFISCSTCIHDLCNYIRISGVKSTSASTSLGLLTLLYSVLKLF